MPQLNSRARQEIESIFLDAGIPHGNNARQAAVGKREDGDSESGIEWVLTTEKAAVVWDWERWEFVEEILLADGMLVPANKQVPLLDCHNRSKTENVFGHVRDFAEAAAGQFAARSGQVFFAADEASQVAKQKVDDGHITDGSVGYRVTKSIWVPEDHEVTVKGRNYVGPVKVSYEWVLQEFSLTPIGADNLAKKVRLLSGA